MSIEDWKKLMDELEIQLAEIERIKAKIENSLSMVKDHLSSLQRKLKDFLNFHHVKDHLSSLQPGQ